MKTSKPPQRKVRHGLMLTMPDPDNPSKTLHLPIKSLPFMNDPPYAPQFYEALGRMFILWGRFEFFFDTYLRFLVALAQQRGIKEEMQISFERKSALFTRLFSLTHEIANRADEARKMMVDAKVTSKERNSIIHSNCNGFTDANPPFVNLVSVLYRDKKFTGQRLEVELADFNRIADQADGLMSRLIALTWGFGARQASSLLLAFWLFQQPPSA